MRDIITRSRVWRSIFRHGWPDNPLDRSLVMTSSLFLHLHPVKVSRRSLKATYSFGLGLLTVMAFVSLACTGALLMFNYVPSVERAYADIVALQTQAPFGQLLRNLHRWGAHLMVITTVLHLGRVFYTGAYKPPRQFNWVVGAFLLLLTLGASFTGYLLPWDQLSYWAITVGTGILSYEPLLGDGLRLALLGGAEVGQPALIRFYALHIVILPGLLALLTSLHLWRVRKDGGLAASDRPEAADKPEPDLTGFKNLSGLHTETTPASDRQVFRKDGTKTYSLVELGRGPATMVEKGPDGTVFSFPVVALIELLLALGMNLALLVFALLKDAPLEEIANPLVTSDPAKAPWYFVGLQELLEHAHPSLAGVLIPTLMVLFMLVLPYIDNSRKGAGLWFTSPRGRRITLLAALYALIVMPAYILIDHAFPLRELLRGVLPELVAGALLPGFVLGLIMLLPLLVLRRWKPDARETLMLLYTLLFVSAIVFTLTGLLFRGPGFELYPPWDMPDGYNPLEHL